MTPLDSFGFVIATFVFAVIAIALVATARSKSAKKRIIELQVTENALTAHYDALDAIVDDPAIPTDALRFLQHFAEAISERATCERFAYDMYLSEGNGGMPPWYPQMEDLRKTRPDLTDNFHKAVSSGIIALFLRWPGKSVLLQAMLQEMAADRRKEARFAEKISRSYHSNGRGNGTGGPLIPGGLVPA